jgi:hypothetical protein
LAAPRASHGPTLLYRMRAAVQHISAMARIERPHFRAVIPRGKNKVLLSGEA